LNFTPIDPIKALFWSAVVNGIVAAPVMAMMMILTMRRDIMGGFTLPRPLQAVGWLATIVMALTIVAMAVTAIR
jgi:Mn2+/Fe2+ NRAMP family transporter